MNPKVYRQVVHRRHKAEMAILKGRVKHSRAMANWREVHYALLNRVHTYPPGFSSQRRGSAIQRQKKLEKNLALKLQKAAAAMEKKNRDWRIMVDKIKKEVRFDENDSRTYNYSDYLPEGAKDEKDQLLKHWRQEVQRSLSTEVYEGFTNISLGQADIQAVFGVQPEQ